MVDKIGMQALLWKPFVDGAAEPKMIRPKKKPGAVKGRVTVHAFKNGWCPASNLTYERAKRAAGEFGEKVVFMEYDTTDMAVFGEWRITDALYIDGKEVPTGPPPKYEKICGIIEKKLKKIK